MSTDGMEEIIKEFIVEAKELIDGVEQNLITLEKNPNDMDVLNEIFRSIHTIKGAAGFLAFEEVIEVTHSAEDLLNELRKGNFPVTPDIMDLLLEVVDVIKELIGDIEKGDTEKKHNISPLIERLKLALEGKLEGAANTEKKKPPQEAQPKGSKEKKEDRGGRDTEHHIRVDIGRVDNVMDLAGELVLIRNRLTSLASKLHEQYGDIDVVGDVDAAISQLNVITTDLQLAVMKMRMQPIEKVLSKFPRMVRDISRQRGKEVELVIKGQDTELDKTVIEEIGDPLVHIIRNAIDHGIEPPEERVKLGKPRNGTITITACQEGRDILISIEDDGRGINTAKIKEKALKLGLVSQKDADKMRERDLMELIFSPGFSTADKTDDISGRGVGMDVVKTNVTKINGSIFVDSSQGKGTKITIRVPLTLAIIHTLTVETAGELYAIPLTIVIENKRIEESEIKTVNGHEVINLRDEIIRIVRLDELLGKSSDNGGSKYIVVVGAGEKRLGLLVDRLHGQEEIVMKSMGEYMKGIQGVAGACITGSGKVVLVLDVGKLIWKMEGIGVNMEKLVV